MQTDVKSTTLIKEESILGCSTKASCNTKSNLVQGNCRTSHVPHEAWESLQWLMKSAGGAWRYQMRATSTPTVHGHLGPGTPGYLRFLGGLGERQAHRQLAVRGRCESLSQPQTFLLCSEHSQCQCQSPHGCPSNLQVTNGYGD